ncbi:hypothetical protein NW754_16792 [Fusarium falciforme]|nr:hypothetical protein NW754_16792 [Fusarium falciforme]KAJ4200677.1 hypothetical protein NW767_15823 [Fusarium falciforme]KAJ4261979.1 hypothetical protein NW757_14863 [Fusarium falciforme]
MACSSLAARRWPQGAWISDWASDGSDGGWEMEVLYFQQQRQTRNKNQDQETRRRGPLGPRITAIGGKTTPGICTIASKRASSDRRAIGRDVLQGMVEDGLDTIFRHIHAERHARGLIPARAVESLAT